jgi:ABC-2 type transport system permease protein
VTLPVTFLSTTFMPPDLIPGWVRSIARFNPVNWAVEAGRLLSVLLVASGTLATMAFRAYQRAV